MQWVAGMFSSGRVDRRIEFWFRLTPLRGVEINNLRQVLGVLRAAGMDAQVLLQSTARKDDVVDEVSAFDALVDKPCAFKVFRAQSDGFYTVCWYGIADALFSLEAMSTALTAALGGKAVLSLVISRVPEVIDDQLLYRFLPPECFSRAGLPVPCVGW